MPRTSGSAVRSGGRVEVTSDRAARRTAAALSLWGFAYACYRAYYAAGGTVGMIGQPVSSAQFRAINAFGAAVLLVAAVLPLVAVRLGFLRRALPVLGWVGAVGCCMHALVMAVLRVLSLTDRHPTQLRPDLWVSFDRRVADLQDLLLNEPWFFVEGLLWAALGLAFVATARRRAWVLSAVAGCLVLTFVGILSGLGVLGTFRLG